MNIYDYINLLGPVPEFLKPYLKLPILQRLKKVGYFCGMDYASKDIYDFRYLITRFDHSLSTSLLTWNFTKSKKETLAALFHDIATPCFSHVIDYMNGDYETQESTEEKTNQILNDREFIGLLQKDGFALEEVADFKQYSIVDTKRPKLCADRLDGIILTNLSWTKMLSLEEVNEILSDLVVYPNEDGEMEIGFQTEEIAFKVMRLGDALNEFTHTKQDTFMMILLGEITKYSMELGLFTYDDLYRYDEETLMHFILEKAKEDSKLREMLEQFKTIKLEDVPNIPLPSIKNRIIRPMVRGRRYE